MILKSLRLLVLLGVILGTQNALGARILGVFHPPAPSHYFIGKMLLQTLAERGHQVTMISPFKNKDKIPNFTDVVLDGLLEDMEEMKKHMMNMHEDPIYKQIFRVFELGPQMGVKALNHTNFAKLLKSGRKFDLVITEAFLSEMMVGLGHHFNCPIVVVSPVGSNSWVNVFTGNPAPSSFVSELFLSHSDKMNFWQRLQNGVVGTFISAYLELVHIPYQNELLHQYFPDAPYIKDLFKKVALVLLNSHVSVSSPKPHMPNMIEIGGFHIPEVKELPKDLKMYLDSCKNGFILMSMGSNFQSKYLKPEMKNTILTVFSKLPYQVLWKYEDLDLPGQPKNLRIEKWIPQNDILAHKNLKLFITHGGLLSTTETVYHGVPIVGIPIFGDQKMNMAISVSLGIGEILDFNNLEEISFLETVKKVIDNPKYRENVQKRSAIMRDQPIKPIDSAVFWIEHVLRHKGGDHFQSPATELKWYQLYQLDVALFVFSVIFFILYIPYKIIKYCCCSKRTKTTYKSEKKTN